MPNSIQEIISRDQYSTIVESQNKTESVIKHEIQRLDSKKHNMDEKEENRRRVVLMTRSYRDKQKAFLTILTVLVLTFGIALCVVFLQERIGVTNALLDIFIVCIVTFGIVISIFIYFDIQRRDKLDFSKLDSAQMESGATKNNLETSEKKGDISGISDALCRGSECCGPGFEYNEDENTCMLK
jgi:hypothetical protein